MDGGARTVEYIPQIDIRGYLLGKERGLADGPTMREVDLDLYITRDTDHASPVVVYLSSDFVLTWDHSQGHNSHSWSP